MDLGWRRRILFMILVEISMFCGSCYSEKAPHYSFVKPATSAPPIMYFDYIIIGGGTSGCALAATLSEGADVLLLERGGAPYGNKNVEDMRFFALNLGDPSPSSPAQRFVSEDGVINARARVLGGGSAINAGFYTRAEPGFVARVGWDAKLVNESYEWVEKKVAFRPPVLQFQSAVKDGLLQVGVQPFNGFTYDHLYGTKIGGSIFDRNGHRHTAADLLEYAYPQRTTVYLYATVHKILFDIRRFKRPRAEGVVFTDALGIKHKAFLRAGPRNEIILSAGAMGSPQLLMLSGIGPAEELMLHGIDLVLDVPLVGNGMADNPMNALFIPSPNPVENSLIQVVGITRFGSYIEAASASIFAQALSLNLPQATEILSPQNNQSTGVPYEQKTPAEIAKALAYINSVINGSINGGVILEKTIGPVSKGFLLLKTTSPYDNPAVTFNYFKEPEDLLRCVEGMKTIIKVVESKPFSKFRIPGMPVEALIRIIVNTPLNLRPRHIDTSTSLEQFCRDTVMTIWHYHGGCRVGEVVDKDYKVIGVEGLRVIDGSTLYDSPGTNPQATVMMLGRYMGKKILIGRLGGLVGRK